MLSTDQALPTSAPPPDFAPPLTLPTHSLNQYLRKSKLQSPSGSRWSMSLAKRSIDITIAIVVLILCSSLMLLIAVLIRLTSRGPAIFVQDRVGRRGRLFRIYKFRSMANRAEHSGLGLTRDGDLRITPVGKVLRKLKLDELPQFYNILRGDMSLVGPRPKLSRYEVMTNMPYRPGITGLATLAFRCEEEMLRSVPPDEVEAYYDRHIKPLKARLDARYMCRATLISDLSLVLVTILRCLRPARTFATGRKRARRSSFEINLKVRTREVLRQLDALPGFRLAEFMEQSGKLERDS